MLYTWRQELKAEMDGAVLLYVFIEQNLLKRQRLSKAHSKPSASRQGYTLIGKGPSFDSRQGIEQYKPLTSHHGVAQYSSALHMKTSCFNYVIHQIMCKTILRNG